MRTIPLIKLSNFRKRKQHLTPSHARRYLLMHFVTRVLQIVWTDLFLLLLTYRASNLFLQEIQNQMTMKHDNELKKDTANTN